MSMKNVYMLGVVFYSMVSSCMLIMLMTKPIQFTKIRAAPFNSGMVFIVKRVEKGSVCHDHNAPKE